MNRRWSDTKTADGDVLVAPHRRDLTSEELRARALGPLTRMISAMCDWGPDGGGRVGDVRFGILDVSVSEDLTFYVQFLTEPGEPVLVEAVSGALHPPIRAFLTPDRRRALTALGYRVGGGARNFQKEWRVTGPAAARGLAGELLGILFETYGYRGRQALRAHRQSDARTEPGAVFSTVTLSDARKMVEAAGLAPAPADLPHAPAHVRRRAAARMLFVQQPYAFYVEMCAPDRHCRGRFLGVGLRAAFAGTAHVPDARLIDIGGALPFVRLYRDAERDVLVCLDLPLRGATAEYFQESLQRWLWVLMKVSTSLAGLGQGRRRQARAIPPEDADDGPDPGAPLDAPAKQAKMLIH
jgi:hypothetical protein